MVRVDAISPVHAATGDIAQEREGGLRVGELEELEAKEPVVIAQHSHTEPFRFPWSAERISLPKEQAPIHAGVSPAGEDLVFVVELTSSVALPDHSDEVVASPNLGPQAGSVVGVDHVRVQRAR